MALRRRGSDRPPHGSQRADFPHWALASGGNAKPPRRIGWGWRPRSPVRRAPRPNLRLHPITPPPARCSARLRPAPLVPQICASPFLTRCFPPSGLPTTTKPQAAKRRPGRYARTPPETTPGIPRRLAQPARSAASTGSLGYLIAGRRRPQEEWGSWVGAEWNVLFHSSAHSQPRLLSSADLVSTSRLGMMPQ
jgi:hypothetical protein